MKSYRKRPPIVEGSQAVVEHEAMMKLVNNNADAAEMTDGETPTYETGKTDHNVHADGAVEAGRPKQRMAQGTAVSGVFSQQRTEEPMKNVQTRVPLSVYEKLNRLKYFNGQRTSIGDIVAKAIQEFVENHPV